MNIGWSDVKMYCKMNEKCEDRPCMKSGAVLFSCTGIIYGPTPEKGLTEFGPRERKERP